MALSRFWNVIAAAWSSFPRPMAARPTPSTAASGKPAERFWPGSAPTICICPEPSPRPSPALAEDPTAAAVYGEGYWIGEDGRTLGRYPTVAPYSPAAFRRECPICQPSCFMRREALEAVGGLDAALQSAFDYDLWIRLSRRSHFRAIPQYLAQSRMHSRNKSLGEKQRMFEECIQLLRRHYGYVPVPWIYGYVLSCATAPTSSSRRRGCLRRPICAAWWWAAAITCGTYCATGRSG